MFILGLGLIMFRMRGGVLNLSRKAISLLDPIRKIRRGSEEIGEALLTSSGSEKGRGDYEWHRRGQRRSGPWRNGFVRPQCSWTGKVVSREWNGPGRTVAKENIGRG